MIADLKNITLINLADFVSVLPISFYFDAFYKFISMPSYESLKYLVGIFGATISSDIIKRIPYPESLYRITRRPKGASNTDYLSKNGEASKDAPGFPSGHMTTTAFYSVYNAIENKNNKVLLLFFGGLVVSMAWARYYKKCHNITQIVGGTLLGSGAAYLTKFYV